ncbi:MAG: hypothetical protein WDW38_008191 [Sanguina aurantia]
MRRMAALSTMSFREQTLSAASSPAAGAPRYRRSSTLSNSVPRKRSFIANMSKRSTSDMPSSGSRPAGGRFGGGGGGRGGGAGRGEGAGAGSMDGGSVHPLPNWAALALGITIVTLFTPAGHSVAQEGPTGSDAVARTTAPGDGAAAGMALAATAAAAQASAALSWSSASAPELGPGLEGQIVYGRVHLTADERLMLSSSVRMVCV